MCSHTPPAIHHHAEIFLQSVVSFLASFPYLLFFRLSACLSHLPLHRFCIVYGILCHSPNLGKQGGEYLTFSSTKTERGRILPIWPAHNPAVFSSANLDATRSAGLVLNEHEALFVLVEQASTAQYMHVGVYTLAVHQFKIDVRPPLVVSLFFAHNVVLLGEFDRKSTNPW